MIAAVRGTVAVRRPDHVVLDSGGVGYRLSVSAETLKSIPAAGKECRLHSHLVMREDSLALYGFATEEERDLFLSLVSVAGVGPKMALAVLSGSPPRDVQRAIAAGDSKRFQSVPGVGKKTADRVIVELREQMAGELSEDLAVAAGDRDDPRALAREGLVGLGYSPAEAEALLASAPPADSAEELISGALRASAPSGAR